MGSINTTKGKTDAFTNSNVGGSTFLSLGKHKNVRIVEAVDVELGAKKSPALQITLEAESGRQIRTTLFYVQNVFVKGKMTEETELSWKIRALTGALIKDEALRSEVFTMCYDNTVLFERLIGFRCNIEIAYPKKGFAILRNSETEEINIVNLKDDEVESTHESFADASDYMKEEGLPRAYTEVVSFTRTTTDSGADVNAKPIQDFIKAGVNPAKGSGTVSPLGKRTAGTSM